MLSSREVMCRSSLRLGEEPRRIAAGWPWAPAAGREETFSYLLSHCPQMWVALLVCRLGLPSLRGGFVHLESLSGEVQWRGVEARSRVL